MTFRTSPLVLAVALGLLNPAALDVEEPSVLDRARLPGNDGVDVDEEPIVQNDRDATPGV